MYARKRSLRHALLVIFPPLLVACAEDPTATTSEVALPDAPQLVLAAIDCSARAVPAKLVCEPIRPARDALGSPQFLIIGGQGTYVLFESPNTSYNAGNGRFTAEVYLTNLIGQALGTDGTQVTGVRVFFHTGPQATDGSGLPVTVNADGTDTFTGASQPYFGFPETLDAILAPGQRSARRNWRFDLRSGATSFGFSVFVAADIAFPSGWVDVSPAAATIPVNTGSQQLTATALDRLGDPVTGRTFTWSTNNASVATVDLNGLVTAGSTTGTAEITATSSGPEADGVAVITVN